MKSISINQRSVLISRVSALIATITLVGLLLDDNQIMVAAKRQPSTMNNNMPHNQQLGIFLARLKRAPSSSTSTDHQHMMHNHLSRKVMDRACAASKDTIDEIVACMTNNQGLLSAVKKETAADCYKASFGQEFNEQEIDKHKELICNNRDKFETMTSCIYKKTSEQLDPKQMERLTETLVDIGLCIINALDG